MMDMDKCEDSLVGLCAALHQVNRVTTGVLGVEIIIHDTEWRAAAKSALAQLPPDRRSDVWFVIARNLKESAKRINGNVNGSLTRQAAKIERDALLERLRILNRILEEPNA